MITNQISKRRMDWPRILLKGIFALVFFALVFSFAPEAQAAVRTSTATGGAWATGGTWVGGVAPVGTDTVIIATTGGNAVTIGAAATIAGVTINSGAILTFSTFGLTVNGPWTNNGTLNAGTATITFGGATAAINSGTGTGNFNNILIANGATLTVNTTATVTGAVTLPNAAAVNVTGTITGSGSLSCGSVQIGNGTAPTGNNTTYTHTLTSTITNFTISGNLTINSYYVFNNRRRNGVFNINSGTVTVNGSVVTLNANAVNISSLSMNIGAQTGTLILNGATPWTLSGIGTNTITLNGTGSTVTYNYAGNQTVLGTAYRNLVLSNSGIKSIVTGTSVAGNLSITPTGSTTASVGNGLNISVNSLTLGSNLKVSGTWGSSNSIATHISDTHFQLTTGYVTVTTGSADATPPTVSTVAIQSLSTVNVTFSEAMDIGATTAANYIISESGLGTLAANPNTVTLVSGNTYVLTWTSGTMVNAADITITVANVQDLAGNVLTTPNSGRSQIRGIIHFGTKVNTFLNGVKQYFYFH